MTERQIAAKRCVEIALEVADDWGHNDPAWNAAEDVGNRIREEFGLETEDAKA